jgi:hypothetical protein
MALSTLTMVWQNNGFWQMELGSPANFSVKGVTITQFNHFR